jgi:NADPH-dependent 2,4-dienoyl-CoA reductase/sulfur reductase-like enzyme
VLGGRAARRKLFVTTKTEAQAPKKRSRATLAAGVPERIVIIGGGAAGFAAAEKLRREQYQRSIVMLSDDDAPPVDRPNLSKDYLAGNAPEDWVPLRLANFFPTTASSCTLGKKFLASTPVRARSRSPRGAISVTTGCCSRPVPSRSACRSPARSCRTCVRCERWRTARAIIARAETARRAVVLGASFIGLEVAAALRARGIDVHVVAPEKRPMERILGPQIGDFVRALHEEHGVVFHLEDTAVAIDRNRVVFKSGAPLDADLVIAGIGVRPRTELAEKAGL